MELITKIEEITPQLFEECDQKGTMEYFEYETVSYEGKPFTKHGYVYLPYGYDKEKKYEILYLIHGGGETAEKYLYEGGEENKLKRAIDNLIKEKVVKPFIVVTPSPYPYHEPMGPEANVWPFISHFPKELTEDCMPVVEAKYHTYADFDVSAENLQRVREHRKVMGWSMGARTTWNIFVQRLSYFHDIATLSGSYATYKEPDSKEWAHEVASTVDKMVKDQGYGADDFTLTALTGSDDTAYVKLALQMSALTGYEKEFDFYDKRNTVFLVWPGGQHHTQWRLQYIINVIKQFYK